MEKLSDKGLHETDMELLGEMQMKENYKQKDGAVAQEETISSSMMCPLPYSLGC